jgi:phosphopantothenoylcysteine decarboxylase/phosphopantothenate--cysteine ligase
MSRHTLISAGATRNPLDAIRYISAFSTGRTGVAIAEALAGGAGAVTLLGSAEACLRATPSESLEVVEYRSTRDLLAKMLAKVTGSPRCVVIHAAAVGDYEMSDAGGAKIPSGSDELVLRLTPTPKIVDLLKAQSPEIRLVSFKAASPETTDEGLVRLASRQRERTGSDLVFANVIGRLSSRILLLGEEPRWMDTRTAALEALIEVVRQWQEE